MSIDFIFRIIGMVILAVVGGMLGNQFGTMANTNPSDSTLPVDQYRFLFGLMGALFGLILTPYFTTRPARAIRGSLAKATTQSLVASLLGLVVGLIVAALLAFPLSLLPDPFGNVLQLVQDKTGDKQRSRQETGAGNIRDATINDHAGIQQNGAAFRPAGAGRAFF